MCSYEQNGAPAPKECRNGDGLKDSWLALHGGQAEGLRVVPRLFLCILFWKLILLCATDHKKIFAFLGILNFKINLVSLHLRLGLFAARLMERNLVEKAPMGSR